ncbi:MAG: ATP-binding cassette domain-containing protein [Oscillospiraceae bacterium]
METIISVKEVTKEFKETTALNHVSIEFEKGKIHGIIGRNGSGKTVLFKCICGLMYPDSGEIWVEGKRIGKDVDMPENVGAIIEAPGFLPTYSGYNNLSFLANINRKIGKKEITEALKTVGLGETGKKRVGKYSLGMRQRLGIAQAIMEDPDILVLDEPMNGLDNNGVEEIRKLLLEMKARGKTILLASHNREDISILCDTVREMDKGAFLAASPI